MRCKKCGNEMKIKAVEVGKDEQGNPIYNDYAFCYECKIKINLDKKKGKKGEKRTEPQEDLSMTRQFEAQMEELVGSEAEEENVSGSTSVREYTEEQRERRPAKRKVDSKEKKSEKRAKEQPKKKPEKRPEREKQIKESQRDHEKKFKEMPEKRVKEVRKKAKGRGFLKFLVFVLIVAGIGAAVYFNRDTVKGWVHWGLEKFDSMSDGKDDKKDDTKSDVTDDIDVNSDTTGGTTTNEPTDTTTGTDTTNPTDNTTNSDTTGTTNTSGTTDNTTGTE